MISRRQLRAARALLGWPAERLGKEADIHFRTVLNMPADPSVSWPSGKLADA